MFYIHCIKYKASFSYSNYSFSLSIGKLAGRSICVVLRFFTFIVLLFRKGEAVDRTLLNHLLKMFTALGIYAETFEKPFLECTSEFYAAEGMKYMQQSDVPDYLKHVEVFSFP